MVASTIPITLFALPSGTIGAASRTIPSAACGFLYGIKKQHRTFDYSHVYVQSAYATYIVHKYFTTIVSTLA